MQPNLISIGMVLGLSVIGVIGDIFLKRASENSLPFTTFSFALGLVLYASTAFGWVTALKHLKMATVGSVYSVATIVLLAASGAIFFGERLTIVEFIGIGMAIGSVVLLARHA